MPKNFIFLDQNILTKMWANSTDEFPNRIFVYDLPVHKNYNYSSLRNIFKVVYGKFIFAQKILVKKSFSLKNPPQHQNPQTPPQTPSSKTGSYQP